MQVCCKLMDSLRLRKPQLRIRTRARTRPLGIHPVLRNVHYSHRMR